MMDSREKKDREREINLLNPTL